MNAIAAPAGASGWPSGAPPPPAPWQGLSAVPVMKYAVLINPLVYVAEGMRAALTPTAPHMPLGIVVLALLFITPVFWMLGIRSFMRRALG